MKTLILLTSLFLTLSFYISFGSNASMFDSDPFEIYPGGNFPPTTNGNVARFSITNSTTWNVEFWGVDTSRLVVTNSQGSISGASLEGQILYVVFKNIKINKTAYDISCLARRLGDFFTDFYTGPGFTLVMPTPTFVSGSTLNIPCYTTTAQISINDYKNVTGLSAGLEITDEFEWTLPSGWQTISSQTGTFVAGKTINLILPSSNSPGNITVRAKAYDQYSASATLQITRNLENFSIEGPTTATCYSTKRFTAPATPSGVTYTWQLPTGWTGVANSNYIDAIVTGTSGTVTCRMTGCGQFKESTKAVTVNIVEPGTIISGASIICSNGSTFSISNLSSFDSIIWSVGPNLSVYSGQNTNLPTIKSTGNGSSWVSARLVTACGNITFSQKTVWAGTPVITEISGPTSTPNYEWATYYAQPNNSLMGATDYFWALSPSNGNVIYDYGWTADIAFYNSGNYQLVVRAFNNQCGWGDYVVTGITVYDSQYLSFSPNPTTGETTLSIENTSKEATFDETSTWEMEIYDPLQKLKEKKTNLKGKEYKLDTSEWKEGVYIVRVKCKDKILTGKLVVK